MILAPARTMMRRRVTTPPERRTTQGARVDVLGIPIAATTYDEVLAALARPRPDRASVVAFCNVHSVMSARRDPSLRRALREADIATPDGMPLVWTLRRSGHPDQPRVYGPDLMRLAFAGPPVEGRTHYLFGTTEATLDRLVDRLHQVAPSAHIVGRYAPPFRPMTRAEERAVLDDIRSSGARVVWVGLGMPKQELWMQRVRDELPNVTLLGVGAAFDLLSGTVPQAPDWIQDRGLEWAFRLWNEPRRLWRRYAVNNPLFLLLTAKVLLRPRHAQPRR
jgi:N-acetylglucosaminyldiphosphoundecaprenol N-acetyl-beta-D-mannosaminyltransferase